MHDYYHTRQFRCIELASCYVYGVSYVRSKVSRLSLNLNDLRVLADGASIILDARSMEYLLGTVLHYKLA